MGFTLMTQIDNQKKKCHCPLCQCPTFQQKNGDKESQEQLDWGSTGLPDSQLGLDYVKAIGA